MVRTSNLSSYLAFTISFTIFTLAEYSILCKLIMLPEIIYIYYSNIDTNIYVSFHSYLHLFDHVYIGNGYKKLHFEYFICTTWHGRCRSSDHCDNNCKTIENVDRGFCHHGNCICLLYYTVTATLSNVRNFNWC